MRRNNTRRGMRGIAQGAIWAALPLSLALTMTGCGGQGAGEVTDTSDGTKTTATKNGDRQTMTNDTDGEHVIEVSGEKKEYSAVDITKTGDADGDEADFYGENSAVFTTEKGTLDLSDATVTTDGKHANAVFSYGEGTVVNVSDTTIETSGDCSGGLMVTGGGVLNANDLDIHTTGKSSAAIRSDRGGGTETVKGGTYKTEGVGSPAIYSTAEVTVSDATLESTKSQGVVIEGSNSVNLKDVKLTASNTEKNSDKSDTFQAVMIYQSMSGDATPGESSFTMTGGSLDNKNGDVFFINNTVTTITLDGAKISNEDAEGMFLRAAAAGWGDQGNNGGHATLNATNQEINGDVFVDSVSSLNLSLGSGSSLNGAVNQDEKVGETYVELKDGAKWSLTADSHIASLTCEADSISLNGHTLYVGETTYAEGTESKGEAIVTPIAPGAPGTPGAPGDSGAPGQPSENGQRPGADGQTPPEKPEGAEGDGSGRPPARPGQPGQGGPGGETPGNPPQPSSSDNAAA